MTKSRDIASAIPAPSTISSAELGYLDGVTSAIQTQIDAKTAKATLTTTGDIYYASSASTPARLGIGSSAQVLTVAGGVPSWATPTATAAPNLASQDFTSSGTWTRPTGVTTAWVLLVGGGGAGGGAAANQSIAGGGGGGGMVKFQTVDVSASSTVTVTLGTGGTGGITFPAADGGDSTFGALLTAKGGKGSYRTTGSVADQNAGAYTSDTGSIGSGGGGGAGGVGGTATGLIYNTTWVAGYFEKYGQATGAGNSAGGTTKFYPQSGNAYVVGGAGGAGWYGYGGGGAGGVFGSGTNEGGSGSSGGGRGANAGAAGGAGTANTGGGGGGAGGDATNRNGGNGGSGFCRVVWVA